MNKIRKEHLQFSRTKEFERLTNGNPIAINFKIEKILNNENLSFKARGLFCVLLKNYGTEFEISRQEILSLSEHDKLIATYNAIKELEKFGILERKYIGKGIKRKLKIKLIFKNDIL